MTDPSKKTNIQESFNLTLTDSNLQNLSQDIVEVAIDSILNDGLLKDLPIVRTLVNLNKIGANIQDKLFTKKILSFLSGLKDISAKDRNKIIKEIDESKKYRIKVGEKLLYILDKCNDYEISELVSKVFKYFIEGKINYDEFQKTSIILSNINIKDFNWFITNNKKYYDLDDVGDMINIGLFELHYEPISVNVENETDYKVLREANGPKYKSDVDGGVSVNLSRSGEIILEIFCPSYKKPNLLKI